VTSSPCIVAEMFTRCPAGSSPCSDDVARRWAKRECPTAPLASQAPTDASCARLWGRSVDAIAHGTPEAGPCELTAEAVRERVGPALPFKPLNIDPVEPLPGANGPGSRDSPRRKRTASRRRDGASIGRSWPVKRLRRAQQQQPEWEHSRRETPGIARTRDPPPEAPEAGVSRRTSPRHRARSPGGPLRPSRH
jgi:hypothetical protein